MQYRGLGRTDLNVSVICLGTMTYGEQNTEAEGHEQMDYALDQGINFFDTAELYSIPPKRDTYGSTETIIGSWFKARQNRDKVILASKVAGRSGMNWMRKDGSACELSPAQIREAVDASLRRLQTDYIDLYQIHWPDRPMPWGSNPTIFHERDYGTQRSLFGMKLDNETPPQTEHAIDDTLHTLGQIVREGKIRHIGLSNESAWGTMRFLEAANRHGLPRVQSIQNAYSLVTRTFEVALGEIAFRESVGLLAYSPLAQGYLSGKYRSGALPARSRKALFDRMQRYETPGAAAAIELYLQLAEDNGLDPAQMALAFVNSRPFVTANIIGATTMEQLKTNIDAIHLTLPAPVEREIQAIHSVYGNPCP